MTKSSISVAHVMWHCTNCLFGICSALNWIVVMFYLVWTARNFRFRFSSVTMKCGAELREFFQQTCDRIEFILFPLNSRSSASEGKTNKKLNRMAKNINRCQNHHPLFIRLEGTQSKIDLHKMAYNSMSSVFSTFIHRLLSLFWKQKVNWRIFIRPRKWCLVTIQKFVR